MLGTSQALVSRAAVLARRVREAGLEEPLRPLTQPPPSPGRQRVHLRSDYRFAPVHEHDAWDGAWPPPHP